jgi:radical SAM superfamily enzyme YgiQ (UPF0313 family)
MLPESWQLKLVDMNTDNLKDKDVAWADYVFVSAMTVQEASAREVVKQSHRLGKLVVAGGPLFTTGHDDFPEIDHFVLGEVETIMSQVVMDIEAGNLKPFYRASEFPELDNTPAPMWSLVDLKKYSSAVLQYSRGCPFDCEFCDIVVLNGHRPRTKSQAQIVRELDGLAAINWHGGIFMVDDNFIGNKRKLKEETMPTIIKWQQDHGFPFAFSTEVSINLADDETLLDLMATAGFDRVFVGIETPNEESLTECNKGHNLKRDLVSSVKVLQQHGLEVQGGFIVGFDSDPLSIFRNQVSFIQQSGIVTAMVGLLNAPRGTKLYHRLKDENRLLNRFTGNNTDLSLNFVPKMNHETLIQGYQQLLQQIYAPKQYYARVRTFLANYRPNKNNSRTMSRGYIRAFFQSLWLLGVREKGRRQFWRFFVESVLRRPNHFQTSMYHAIIGLHFRRVAEQVRLAPVPSILPLASKDSSIC